MDVMERRNRLMVKTNPAKQTDYLVDLHAAPVKIRYIPDKVILDPDCLEPYLNPLKVQKDISAEELAAILLDDLNNELVPRWVHVHVKSETNNGSQHDVIMEESQPNWENAKLISRLNLF